MWVNRTIFDKLKDLNELNRVVVKALSDMTPGKEQIGDFSVEDVNVQWTSFKPSRQEKEPEPSIGEQEKYNGMMKDFTTDVVVLYAHGGFY